MRALSAVELFGFSLSAHTLLALIEVAYVCAIIHSESRGKWDSEGRLEVLHSTCTVRQSQGVRVGNFGFLAETRHN